jgi:hypothetical protein
MLLLLCDVMLFSCDLWLIKKYRLFAETGVTKNRQQAHDTSPKHMFNIFAIFLLYAF